MKINGKYLAWSIIHLTLFLGLFIADWDLGNLDITHNFLELIWLIGFLTFFGWRFIENMKKTFVNDGNSVKENK